MLIPSPLGSFATVMPSLSRRVNANSQPSQVFETGHNKLIKKGEC